MKKISGRQIVASPTATAVAGAIPIVASLMAASPPTVVALLIASLPVLQATAAGMLHAKRLEAWVEEVNDDVSRLEVNLHTITEEQYAVAAECCAQAHSTVNTEKLDYLRAAVLNSLSDPSITQNFSEKLGRVIRDITAAEAKLVVEFFAYDHVCIAEKETALQPNTHTVWLGTEEAADFDSLINMRLLQAPHGSSWGAEHYSWTPLAGKLIALITMRVAGP